MGSRHVKRNRLTADRVNDFVFQYIFYIACGVLALGCILIGVFI